MLKEKPFPFPLDNSIERSETQGLGVQDGCFIDVSPSGISCKICVNVTK